MLSDKATQLTIALVEKIDAKVGGAYKIFGWDEIAPLVGKETVDQELKDLFEEVRLNSCLTLKYKDDNEVCFAMTDKAILLKQDLDAMKIAQEGKVEAPMVKVDDQGNSMVVLHSSKIYLQIVDNKSKAPSRISSFFAGIGGGALGGALIYAIIYIVQNLL